LSVENYNIVNIIDTAYCTAENPKSSSALYVLHYTGMTKPLYLTSGREKKLNQRNLKHFRLAITEVFLCVE